MQEQIKFSKFLKLFWCFFKIGAFTFGGGYAMIPLIQKEVVEKQKWVTDDDIFDIIAIAESTPGPIAINSATFIGYKTCGVMGSVAATLGVVLPSFVIILLISYLLREFATLTVVKYAFFGIRAGVLALILKAFYTMYKKFSKTVVAYIIAALGFIVATFTNVSVLIIIAASAAVGLISSLIEARRQVK